MSRGFHNILRPSSFKAQTAIKKIICWGQGFEFSLENKCFFESGLVDTCCVCTGLQRWVDSSSTSCLYFIGIN